MVANTSEYYVPNYAGGGYNNLYQDGNIGMVTSTITRPVQARDFQDQASAISKVDSMDLKQNIVYSTLNYRQVKHLPLFYQEMLSNNFRL